MDNTTLKALSNATILIVEDDLVALFGIKQALEPYCKNILEASDGLEALELYKNYNENIDIVLTDINIPSLNAFEMLEEICKINTNQKIIIMTSYPNDKNLKQSFKLSNICLFLRKPINISDLQTNIAILTKTPNDLIIKLSKNMYVNKTKMKIFIYDNEIILNGIGKKIFWLLINNINQVITYDIIQEVIYNHKENSSIDSLRMAIARLKTSLKEKNIIINIKDSGYMIKSYEETC
ncbi:response regulator [Helicobacter sp. MIT 14-3879]|uniref:response regulator n=1 Tax=Helicobacter sp. MIT 14-3879 TaxID=2040649 RepID=UPI000E1F77BE|nr:response regulator [Helicobacter sp. MIT 14-3879]RDU63533.1 hypothetical protein CQA44_05465 [Helicobacter sp. MIT 14-3879]